MYNRLLSETLFAFVDVETTGLRPTDGDRVCEIAIIRTVGEAEVERFVSLVDPGCPISPGAAAVNGLTNADVRGQPRFAALAPRVAALLEGAVFVAHNAPFDLRFLDAEMMAAGYHPLGNTCVDTLELARSRYRLPSYSLANLAARLGIEARDAHRALADVQTTRALLNRIIHDTRAKYLADLDPSIAGLPLDVAPVPSPLIQAIRQRRRVRLVYESSSGVTDRLVEPFSIHVRGQIVYLSAYCHLRQERRTFRVDRIRTMTFDGEDAVR
ncbi:MAG: exonuclease domain-containing protein [Anaerolineae bacterium]